LEKFKSLEVSKFGYSNLNKNTVGSKSTKRPRLSFQTVKENESELLHVLSDESENPLKERKLRGIKLFRWAIE